MTAAASTDTRLDGVRFADFVTWPGPIHEGDGTAQLILDGAATPEQREAIEKLASGENSYAQLNEFDWKAA